MPKRLFFAAAALLAALPAFAGTHALAMHGEPKYGPAFKHFAYVNPAAPKGGAMRTHAIGTFDNLNPFILKGVAPTGIGRTFDTLLVRSEDEPFTMYGLIAEAIEVPKDRSFVKFKLNPKATFSDGKPVTAEDVIFTFETLKEKGHPFYRAYYSSVKKAQKEGTNEVKFTFAEGDNRELPLIIGEMPVLSKSFFANRDFEKTTLDPLLGSGPYKVDSVDPGRSIVYRRNPSYWGKDLPVNVGKNNFDTIRVDYYRDQTVALEAFKAGEYDFRAENTAKTWATGYDFPAVKEGKVILKEIPHKNSSGMQGFAFNTRKALFADPKVRKALSYAFDFESANKQLFHNSYTRTDSYFDNSDLASTGLPTGEELEILKKYKGRIPGEVFTTEYQPPSFAGNDANEVNKKLRDNLLTAKNLLEEAGWKVVDGKLRNAGGEVFSFEILLENPAFERISLPFAKNLERLGIEAKVRTIDPTQYEKRMETFDFDMTVEVFGQSLSPGNEQRDFWTSKSAGINGSRNTIGVRDPVVDELVELVISAKSRESLVARTKALDRVLLYGYYVIPQWHISSWRVAYWNKFGIPPVTPPYELPVDAWWSLAAPK
ncbi:ABC transporter substrate-binding protein [bacterium]|nr:MAG: ABC transporter substrate-binding protein [bacterium]